MCSINHHNDGHIAVTIPAAIGVQEALIESDPKKFYRPPYVGVAGWVGIELPRVSDKELAAHLREAWKLIAPEKLHALHLSESVQSSTFDGCSVETENNLKVELQTAT